MSHGGLLGLAIGAATEASYETDVTLDEMQLLQSSSGDVLWDGTVEGAVTGTSRLIASTHWDVYDYANEALKIAVTSLVEELGHVRFEAPVEPPVERASTQESPEGAEW